ncbi:MAG: ATP-dependent DNA helicase RecQ [Melioribacteraceae bacterium]|nr:ATP-dependent DNA helicase RecQ [Melioribacteraceae bacterium]
MTITSINKIVKEVQANSSLPIVLIMKGYPAWFLSEMGRTIPNVSNFYWLTEQRRIDLDYILKNFWSLGSYLTQPQHEVSFILYEEFLHLPSHTIKQFPVQFALITNSLYDFYPNQYNKLFADIEASIDNDMVILEDELFNKFFADCKTISGYQCIQYLDYPEKLSDYKINSYDFCDYIEKLEPETINEINNVELPQIQFLAADSTYEKLKYSLFLNESIRDFILIVDDNFLHIEKNVVEYDSITYLLSFYGFSFKIFTKKENFTDYWRDELSILLEKHWGEGAKFKELKIYKDPDTSSELIRYSQGSVVEHIIHQYELANQNLLFEDIFLTAPTGAGKSLLFQLPAIYLSENYENKPVTIVISPLKALMADQVISLINNRKYRNVAFLNSDLSLIEREKIIEEILAGEISIIYMSPELLLSYDIKTFIGERDLGLVVIDEAHLVTTWGRDFRVDYWFLGNYIRKLRRGNTLKGKINNQQKTYRFPVVALTATAVYNGNDDMVFETIGSLNMQNCRIYIGNIIRNEIHFEYNKFHTHTHDLDKINKTKDRIKEFVDNNIKSILYFPWISQIEAIAPTLDKNIKQFVKKYHAELDSEERKETLSSFKDKDTKVVLATKAFGMGVDISDIEVVYHHAPSGALSDYVQEIGRVARTPNIIGKAKIDFTPKDLKYTKILFGLSSLKQYQVNLVIKKVWDLYSIKRNRNMLVSIEDFNYIFTKDNNSEQKVKSALLVIEKDLLAKFGYNIIIVRPKSLFSVVYSATTAEYMKIFMRYFGEFCEVLPNQQYELQKVPLTNGAVLVRGDSSNKKYLRIHLDKIWEKHFADLSFPELKHKYFQKELFPNINPMLKLALHFKVEINEAQISFDNYITTLEKCLFSENLIGRYFTKDDLIKELKKQLGNEVTCRKLADLLIVFYGDINTFGKKGISNGRTSNFIQLKKIGESVKYKIVNTAFTRVKSEMKTSFSREFGGIGKGNTEYQGFVSIDKDHPSRSKVKLAYLLEIFDLATYELSGGDLPQLFVRINDPLKIKTLSERAYQNNVVTDVERRHSRSVEIMTYFFQAEITDELRWQFIENYFLGRDDLIDDCLRS